MKKLIKKLNLKQINLMRWENDNYILELKPNDLALQAAAIKCLIYSPDSYPKIKKEIKRIGKIPIEITSAKDYTLIKTNVKKYKQYIELIKNNDFE
jgi:hypothetical protein